jgi:hypothetical protein
MRFARFSRFGLLSNWGEHSELEDRLLTQEQAVADAIAKLEPWATDDSVIQGLLRCFRDVTQKPITEPEYADAARTLSALPKQFASRRAEILNETGRALPSKPTFRNHLPEALLGEVQNFLVAQEAERGKVRRRVVEQGTSRKGKEKEGEGEEIAEQEREEDAPLGRTFRISAASPELRERVLLQGGGDAHLTEMLERSLDASAERLTAQIRTGALLIWVFTVDGRLTVGAGNETKHSVLAGGADVWAAGRVQLKIDEALDSYHSWRQMLDDAAAYAESSDSEVALGAAAYYAMADEIRSEHEGAWKSAGFGLDRSQTHDAKNDETGKEEQLIEQTDENAREVVVVDFDSGHYQPTKAWQQTIHVWESLGYQVEFDPSGRTA